MPRNVSWRRTYSDVACASQMLAANATIYIMRQTGPTGFLLKEEEESKTYKVFLGDPHSCTCPAFRKEKDLCKHICWVLLKKFRLNRDNPLSWQLGLSDLEMDEVMRGPVVARRAQQQRQQPSIPRQVADASGGRAVVAQREIADDDVCPICQEEFMDKKLPVTFCKFGCGNNVHIKCMKVWAEHQLSTSQDHTIKCPMCREDFGPITLLKQEMRNAETQKTPTSVAPSNANRMDRHAGLGCSNCRMAPIEGKCYRCCTCADFYLCQTCFNTPAHTHHSFQFRHKRNERWRNAQRMLGAALPDALVNDLMNRELSASDYETLLQLDSSSTAAGPLSDLTEETVQMLPVERVKQGGALMAPGSQCRVCLRGFTAGQYVRKLPCQHKFHKDCIDGWLLHSRPTCPVDSSPVFTTRPRSDTSQRQGNRTSVLAGTFPEHAGNHQRGIHEEMGSLSLPSLGVTSMRVGGVEEGRREGDRGSLSRRPHRDPQIPHRPPARMELTGVRVGAENNYTITTTTAAVRRDETESEMLAPGGRLIQEAMERRSQLNQHLLQLMTNDISSAGGMEHEDYLSPHIRSAEPSVSVTGPTTTGGGDSRMVADPHFQFDTASLGQQSAVNPSSIHERARQKRQGSSLRSKAPLRQYSSSQSRVPLSSAQDLFLGNDPRLNPPPVGEVTAAQMSGRAGQHRPPVAVRKLQRGSRGPRNELNIMLEGTRALDNLTLRDLL